MAAAIAAPSPSATSRPVSPSMTTSGMPACQVATTGRPLSWASITATGDPSWSPSGPVSECCRKPRQSRIQAAIRSGERSPFFAIM